MKALVRLCAIGFAAIACGATGAAAQTLIDPNPPKRNSPPPVAAKRSPDQPVKTCPEFGAGFVRVPGSDTCVKIGGWVEGEVGRIGR
jgi:hypothetical protein